MAIGDISLSASARSNLLSLQSISKLLGQTQSHLASGKKVNSATDDANAFFASQGFLNRANDLANLKNSLSTALQTVTSTTDTITSIQAIVTQLQGLTISALQSSSATTRAGLASQFNDLRTQLDLVINDATFNGTNLVVSTGNKLTVFFNETNTTALTITGVNITSTGLGITAAKNAFVTDVNIQTAASLLLTALSTLRTDASSFGNNSTLIQTRQNFTNNLINTLQTASDNLTLADTNQEGANLQALQAQNQLGIVSLGISGQLAQSILRLFP